MTTGVGVAFNAFKSGRTRFFYAGGWSDWEGAHSRGLGALSWVLRSSDFHGSLAVVELGHALDHIYL